MVFQKGHKNELFCEKVTSGNFEIGLFGGDVKKHAWDILQECNRNSNVEKRLGFCSDHSNKKYFVRLET